MVVDVVEAEVVVVVIDEAADVELVVLSEETVEDVEVWDVSEVEVENDDVEDFVVDDVITAVVDASDVVGVDVELVMLSVEIGTVVELSIDASVMDDETDSTEVVTIVEEPGISVDVTVESGVVEKVSVEIGDDSVEAIDGTVSVDAWGVVPTMIVELSI